MRHFRRGFAEQVAKWDRPTQLALALGVVLLFVMLLVMQFGGDALRNPAAIGVGVAILAIQGVILWGNRHMVSPITLAQRHYLAGDFEAAAEVLEAELDDPKIDAKALTLLGNTYRQLGRLSESENILYEAVNISPEWHFPLYGFGRTLLVRAEYERAIEVISQAIELGAPSVVWLDVAEAYYRLGNLNDMATALDNVPDKLNEAHRVLMRDYLRWQQNPNQSLDASVVAHGRGYWVDGVQRFAGSAYGEVLQSDLEQMQSLH